MKPLGKALSLALAASLGGCITAQPFPLNAQAPILGIPPERKLPLNVAVVIPDPMGMRMLFSLKRNGTEKTEDRTNAGNGEGIFPLSRELAKVSQDTFSQVFAQASVVRQLPAAGEYDAVVRLAVPEAIVHKEFRSALTILISVKLSWTASVLNRDNVEVFAKSGVAVSGQEAHNQGFSFSMKRSSDLVGREASEQIQGLVREAALAIAKAPAVRALEQK